MHAYIYIYIYEIICCHTDNIQVAAYPIYAQLKGLDEGPQCHITARNEYRCHENICASDQQLMQLKVEYMQTLNS